MWRVLAAAVILAVSFPGFAHVATAEADPPPESCPAVGSWIDPGTGASLPHARVIEAMAERPIVLLGEVHDAPEHHRWQLATIAALHGRNPDMVLGFEAFPRRVQPVLDRWVRGELGAEAFLDEVDWREIWGFDPDLYLPLFHFARLHRVPMAALNVERALVSRVGREGWEAVPPGERMGIGDPAAPSAAYEETLAEVYIQHLELREEPAPEPADVIDTPGFRRFMEAQLTWDRAMAEALAEALAEARGRPEAPLVVGVIGRGHLDHGHGVPHQLEDLGIADAAVLLPHDGPAACADLPPGLADAVFVLPDSTATATAEPPRPRLGVVIEPAETGVRVAQLVPDGVAAAAGVRVGDTVIEAAGFAVESTVDLVEIVRRQAPGTWLPLKIEREGTPLELVARFPTRFDES